MQKLSAKAAEEWRQHWKLALASAVGISMASMALGSLGAFMQSLEREFGWTRAEISSGFSIFALSAIILSPVLGTAVDRWGPRRFGVAGTLICGAGFAMFGTATASAAYWIALWVLFSAAATVVRPLVWSAAISSEFDASRGLALALVIAGSGLGGVVAPMLAGFLIDAVGWRLAYAVMGLGWGGLAWIICYFFFYGRSDRLGSAAGRTKHADAVLTGVSARTGLASFTFVRLAGSTFLLNTTALAIAVHTIPLLTGTGLSRADATMVAGMHGMGTIMGQLLSGTFADRLPGNRLCAAVDTLLVAGCALLLIPTDSFYLRLISILCIGISTGAHTYLIPFLTTRFFGLRAFGKIYGVIASISAICVGLGPVLAGYIYDRTQSYDTLLMIGVPAGIIATLLTLSLGPYPADPAKLEDDGKAPDGALQHSK
jgi:MFS family permease